MKEKSKLGCTAVRCAFMAVLGVGPAMSVSASAAGAAEMSDTTSADHWEVSARASTLGAGLELKRTFGDSLSVRAVVNGFSYSLDEEYSDVNYEGDLKLKSGGLILDYHPGGYWFRVSAGLLLNGNELELDAKPARGTIDFNDVTYTAAEVGSAQGKAEFDSLAPYLGVGFSSAPGGDSGMSFSADIGVLFQGAPSFALDVRCGTAVPAAQCTQLKQDADAERAQFEDDADSYKYYPVVSLAIGYRW